MLGLREWELTHVHTILTFNFKNISRIFEAEIFKIFRIIQPWLKSYSSKKRQSVIFFIAYLNLVLTERYVSFHGVGFTVQKKKIG